MNKMTIRDIEVGGRRALVRVDFNVPLDPQTGTITDDTRIRATLPTIRYLIERGVKVILASHLGRPKGKVVDSLRMTKVAQRLSQLLGQQVGVATDCIGPDVESSIVHLKPGHVLLLENLRFHPEEEKNNLSFAQALARLADIYVNDAFGASHRAHASITGITNYLPAVAGFLLEKEVETLGQILKDPAHPFATLLGGAKVSDKVALVENIENKVDYLLIGGGMAATFLKAKGYEVGQSLVEEDMLDAAVELINKATKKGVNLVLPLDVVVTNEISPKARTQIVSIEEIPRNQKIVDIGDQTIRAFRKELRRCQTVFWNGPMGIYEIPKFARGTKAMANALANLGAITIIGGGSTAEVVIGLGLADKMTFVSTGGGASMTFLSGEPLPGVEVLLDKRMVLERNLEIVKAISISTPSKIVMLVIDGLGGLPDGKTGKTELETARKPNLDQLASKGACGLMDPVSRGITPGSGPGHLALFGYNPLTFNVGRGVLETMGIDFELLPKDVAARGNFCTVDDNGVITDRRAGRISTEKSAELCKLLDGAVIDDVQVIVRPVREHRFIAVFRGERISPELTDSDPEQMGMTPKTILALRPEAGRTANVANQFVSRAKEILSGHNPANMILFRGFSRLPSFPTLSDVYKLKPAAIASYPMYRGLARLVGMEILNTGTSIEEEVKTLRENYARYDFFFMHIKGTDSAGEDGDFARKVKVLEQIDRIIPEIRRLEPDVFIVTGDHSTPAVLKKHSWHPVPVILYSHYCRPCRVTEFSEPACSFGELGRFPAMELMTLAMAHALKLNKYGA